MPTNQQGNAVAYIHVPFPESTMRFLLILAFLTLSSVSWCQAPPRALAVIAHPDDEGAFSATLYKITKEHKGVVDIFCITNGEAGFKYSTLAESIYGLELTDEKVGRANLPWIRRQELTNAGKVIGVRKIFFINQKDAHYGQDEHEPLDTSWNVKLIRDSLHRVLLHNKYDFVFTLFPSLKTHGGHKAATLLALQEVQKLTGTRPIVLSSSWRAKTDTVEHRSGLAGYPETDLWADTAMFKVWLTAPIGFKGRMNYNIIKGWEVAEHKSQGTMHLFMQGRSIDYEIFYYYKLNGPENVAKAQAFFKELEKVPYAVKSYPGSPGNQ